MLEYLAIAIALFFGCVWGGAENRIWKESGEWWILNHFKQYHLLMALLFSWVNALTVSVVFQNYFVLQEVLFWVWLMIWDVLMLDVVWWVIRYLDLKHLGEVMFAVKFLRWQWVVEYPAINDYDCGQGKPWHSREDWDNWLHPELWFGTYAWWFVMAGLLVVIGSGIVVL